MKKCSYCGLENPDETMQCSTCHTSLESPKPSLPLNTKPLKRFLPYLLSYFVVASCVVAYDIINVSHMSSSPSKYVILNSSMSYVIVDSSLPHDELATKLKQAGLPEASNYFVKPDNFYLVVHRLGFLAVVLAAFVGLVFLFRRTVRAREQDYDRFVS